MEPQEKVWSGEPGQKYAITSPKMCQTLAAFNGIGEFYSDMKTYPHTLFRFPLRQKASGLSERCYDISMLKELLEALKEEAEFLLVFLRTVVVVKVVEISKSGDHITLFEVSINGSDLDIVSEKRQRFLQELKSNNLKQRKSTYRICYEAKFHVEAEDRITGSMKKKHWLVTTTVGSDDPSEIQAANNLNVLPWVGCALELESEVLDDSSGRLFCFLPLPHETCSPLPIHVNGTFGLDDNRRSLKWPSKERKHDSTANWNMTIVKSLLPYCYTLLIRKAIEEGIPFHSVYTSWPQCDKLRHTPWSGLMQPLFDLLFGRDSHVLWSKISPEADAGKWISLQQATIITSSDISPVLHQVLSTCGLQLVDFSDYPQIREALRVYNKKTTELSPALVRKTLRAKKGVDYSTLSSNIKHELLKYCLVDGKFSELQGLELLPLANGSFVAFTHGTGVTYYVCSDRHNSGLLPGLENRLVDLTNECLDLHKELVRVASTNKTQLQKLNPEAVAHLLPHCMPPAWKDTLFAPISGSAFSGDWFKFFWEWLARCNISLEIFENQLILPVVKYCSRERELCIARLVKQSCVISVSEDSVLSTNMFLMKGVEKFNVYFTGTMVFPYLQSSRNIREYVYSTTPHSVLSALRNAYSDDQIRNIPKVKLTIEEAEAIQQFLPDKPYQEEVVRLLPIFLCEKSNVLHSLSSASRESWGGKAVMVTSNSNTRLECNSDILPPNLLLLCPTYHQNRLVKLYTGAVDTLHWVDLVLYYLFPMIRSDHYPHNKLDVLMEALLDELQAPKFSGRSELVKEIKNIHFLKKDAISALMPPCKMFDPSTSLLQDIVPAEMFPKKPFNKPSLLPQLCECGLRQALTAQEVLKVVTAIGSKKTTNAEINRAKSLLKYMDRHQNLMNQTVHFEKRDVQLRIALQEYSKGNMWLPQLVKPPECYPSSLPWKGKSLPGLVSLGPETFVCSPKYLERDCMKIGSATTVVVCPDSVCTVLGSALKVNVVIKHIKVVIRCYAVLEKGDIDATMLYIYEFFQRKKESYIELKSSLPSNWIWVGKIPKFLSTKSIYLKHSASLQQDLEPYMYILPESLQKFASFFKAMGVKETVSDSQLLNVLAAIKETDTSQENTEELWMSVMAILTSLTLHGKQPVKLKPKETLYIPTNSELLHLEDSSKVCYADYDFLQEFLASTESLENEDKCILCHDSIKHMAPQLHLKALSEYYELSEDLFEDFGPHEPLVLRLKNILRDYKDGLTIIKELLQNADDAGATEVNLCYDTRQHSVNPKTLLYSGMSECNGPALVVHNDATFTDEDFQNITKLAAATKREKPLKIGKFGVGFCSVYHITDIPCFVSREHLYIFDPTLQYLKQHISDKSRPGKRLNFTKKIATFSNQLAPFVGLFKFQTKISFNGTMFRFPFRTSASEISTIQYTDHHIEQLKKDIYESGAKLLLFLQSVRRITFSRVDEGHQSSKIEILLDICKEMLQISLPLSDTKLLQVCTRSVGDDQHKSLWLVSNCTEKIEFGGRETDAMSSVASGITNASTAADQFSTVPVEGEVFCFLPLAVMSGLPVHVSANFAVQNDRSGIRTSDDHGAGANEAEWNVDLMKHVVPNAYTRLLLSLSLMHTNKTITDDYACYTLLPLKKNLTAHNPWNFLIAPLYSATTEHKLMFSEYTRSWLTISEGLFLSPGILASGKNENKSVQDCIRLLKLPVVDIPSDFEAHLPPHQSLQELDFVRLFFDNIAELEVHTEKRNNVIRLILLSYWRTQYNKKAFREILCNNRCIPCAPDGELLRHCHEVIDPNAYFAGLYETTDGVFPIVELQSSPTNQILIDLGMVHETLEPSQLIDRAKTIQALHPSDPHLALKRAKIVLKCISFHPVYNQSMQFQQITSISFVPVKQRPSDYPESIHWEGDNHTLLSPDKIHCSQQCESLAGSQVCIACTSEPEHGGCGSVGQAVVTKLGIKTTPQLQHVVDHFKHIIQKVTSRKCTSDFTEWVTLVCSDIYTFLEDYLRDSGDVDLRELGNCVWTGSCFVSPKLVASEWAHNGPYLFPVPATLTYKRHLFAALEIKDHFSVNTFVEALQKLKDEFQCKQLDRSSQDFLTVLLAKLGQRIKERSDWKSLNCCLPDSNFVLRNARELDYDDAHWCNPNESGANYVNSIITKDMAKAFGVRPIRAKLLDEYENTDVYEGEGFGQVEELTQRIKNILEDYPFDITLLKELLQNADDAKASKMMVILDKRTHGTTRVPSDEWKDLQGPALLVWNNSTFTKEDMDGIQKLGLGSKGSESEKIGMYGIGFNVVYHVTDCPSFISTERGGQSTLCVFDPHCRYIPGAKEFKPGRRFNLDERFWGQWSDVASAYLRQDKVIQEEVRFGSLFRFPLRCRQDLVDSSNIVVDSSNPLEAETMETLLLQWAQEMKEAMFFLNNVTQLKFYVINGSTPTLLQHYKVTITPEGQQSRDRIQKCMHDFSEKEPTPHLETYILTVTENFRGSRIGEPKKWIIQQGIGDMQKPDQCWQFLPRMKPKHGIAAPLSATEVTEMRVFCFLPLPVMSYLPVHINGSFILNSSRRQLWRPTTSHIDDKTKWNQSLIEAIASSYAHMLANINIKEVFIPGESTTDTQQLLQCVNRYYQTFPSWLIQDNPVPEGECLRLAKLVYYKLYLRNESVLVHLKESDEGDYHTEFLPLVNKKYPSKQPYFYDRKKGSLNSTLTRIGMHLTEAPTAIYEHFLQLNKELCRFRVTRESVFRFYCQFGLKVFSAKCTVQSITKTKFGSVENFKEFTLYLLQSDEGGRLEYPSSPFHFPLLLTADGRLRKFDPNNKAIRSEFTDLFSNSKAMFLHPELMDINYEKDYFLKPNSKWEDIVQGIISSTFPSELKCDTIHLASSCLEFHTLRKLWECLSKEEFFLVHLENIIETWALIPSKTRDLFSIKCSFLPFMEIDRHDLRPYYSPPPKYDQEIVQVLNDLGMPELDDTVIEKKLAEKFCPKVSDAAAIIRNLYFLHRKSNVLVNNESSFVRPLLKYCSTIHLEMDSVSLNIVKSLPLFRNIDGKLCSIENGAFIWPDKMCDEGKEVWSCGSGLVFLKEDGEWNCLSALVLGIQRISHFVLYTSFIFPVFYKLTERQRLCHLKVIRDSLYEIAEHETKNVFITNKEGKCFIEALKKLCFITRKNGTLGPANEFADPRKTILDTFKHHFNFPLAVLQEDKWLDFLIKIGLRTCITSQEFLQFCNEVSKGKHADLRAASHELTKYLFDMKEWHTEKYYLQEVSKIPFVCTEYLRSVSWIHKCANSQNPIQQGSKTLHFTSLAKAADHEHYKLIWTVKPVVRLPSYPEFSFSVAKQKRRNLLLSLNVSNLTIEEVVENVRNISSTKLSDFTNFENYSVVRSKDKDRISLMEVMFENLKFLGEQIQTTSKALGIISPLKNMPCIPVCAEGNIDVVTCPVLVKPNQVIAQTCESIREFMPFINRLPNIFYSILPSVLCMIGVEQSIMFTHIQGALETIHKQCGKHKLDVNSIKVVKILIKKLHELLQSKSSFKFHSESVLYLPNSNYTLVDSRTLLYQDSAHFRKTTLTFGKSQFSELHLLVPLKDIYQHYRFNMKDLCHLIPQEQAPKPLTRSCREVKSASCHREVSLSTQARSLQRACKLPLLPSAASSILKHQSNPPKVCEKLRASLDHFFRCCEVITVRHLTVDLWLKVHQPEVCIGTAQVDFHIEKNENSKICLYIDKDARRIFFFESLSRAIMALTAEMSGVRIKDIKEPDNVLTYLLKAETSEEVQSTLREIGVKDFALPNEHSISEDVPDTLINPVLGEHIPEPWHYRLQQDYNNIFRPGEIVGYEIEENNIVFASIGYKVAEGDMEFVEYYIYLEEGEEDGRTVSVLDIYKIRRSVISSETVGSIRDLVVYEGHRGDEEPVSAPVSDNQVPKNLTDIKREIGEELKKIWKLPGDLKRKALRRMYLKWHPDKNPGNTELAEEAFKFLKRQVERLEEGKPMEDPEEMDKDEGTQTPRDRGFSSSFWDSFFRTWDNTAHSHSYYHQREWRWSEPSGGSHHQSYPETHTFGFSFPDPTAPDKDKARKWMKQAECDFVALSILAESCRPEVCANICFLAHEVAEKALKAGMLAVWGLRTVDFKNHKKTIDFAINLQQEHPHLCGLLVYHVSALPTDKFYYQTRWPNWYGVQHAVPADCFDESTARKASDDAKAIIDMLKLIV